MVIESHNIIFEVNYANFDLHFPVVLSLAKMELENFFKSVMPVADYFDQSDMLVAVSKQVFIVL